MVAHRRPVNSKKMKARLGAARDDLHSSSSPRLTGRRRTWWPQPRLHWNPASNFLGPPRGRYVQGSLNHEVSFRHSFFLHLVQDVSGNGEGDGIRLVKTRIIVLAVDEQGYRKQAGLALLVNPQEADGAHADVFVCPVYWADAEAASSTASNPTRNFRGRLLRMEANMKAPDF